MSITVQYHEVTDEHLGFTSARHNADGSVTIFYGDEPLPLPEPVEIEPAPPTRWQLFKAFFTGKLA